MADRVRFPDLPLGAGVVGDLLRSATEVRFALDPRGVVVSVTPSVTGLTGYSTDQLLNRPLGEMVAAPDRPALDALLASVSASSMALQFRHVTGGLGVELHVTLDSRTPAGPVLTARDETTWRMVNWALGEDEHEDEHGDGSDSSPLMVLRLDRHGRCTWTNSTGREWTRGESHGDQLDWREALHTLNPEQMTALTHAIERGRPWRGVVQVMVPGLDLRSADLAMTPVSDTHGTVRGFAVVAAQLAHSGHISHGLDTDDDTPVGLSLSSLLTAARTTNEQHHTRHHVDVFDNEPGMPVDAHVRVDLLDYLASTHTDGLDPVLGVALLFIDVLSTGADVSADDRHYDLQMLERRLRTTVRGSEFAAALTGYGFVVASRGVFARGDVEALSLRMMAKLSTPLRGHQGAGSPQVCTGGALSMMGESDEAFVARAEQARSRAVRRGAGAIVTSHS